MSELSGTIHSTAISMDGKPLITFMVNEYRDCMKTAQELTGQPVSIKVTKQKKKRSLDSNAYFWILVDKLSQKMNALYPESPVFMNNIGSYYMIAEKDYKTALKYYTKVQKKFPDDYTAIKNGSLAAKMSGNQKLEKKFLQALARLKSTEE